MPSADPTPLVNRTPWRYSLLAPQVWKRAACYGFPAGLIQAALNQGDHWMSGHATTLVVLKSVLSPLVGFGVAYIAAATTHHETYRLQVMPVGNRESRNPPQHGLS
jgi:hypothetical protein